MKISTTIEREMDDHIYYNVNIYNNTDTLQPLSMGEKRGIPILEKCDEYHMAIVRFTSAAYNIPLFEWPGDTFFALQLQDGNKKITQYLINNVDSNDIFVNGIYQINDFIMKINLAIADIYIANGPWSFTQPPYFYFDTETGMITCYAPSVFKTSPLSVKLNVNYNFIRYFGGFSYTYLSASSPYTSFKTNFAQLNFLILPFSDTTVQNIYIPGSTAINGTKVSQNSGALNWSSVKAITFGTNTIPIKSEFLQNIGSDTNNQFNIATDLEPNINILDSHSNLQYTPSIYRYIDMLTNSPLKSIDITVYWTNISGVNRLIYIGPGQFCSIKILFSRKYSIK